MQLIKQNRLFVIINTVLFAVIIILRDSGILTFKIGSVSPLLPLALLVAVCIFCTETAAAFCGMVVGMFMDSVSSACLGFNTIIMLLLGVVVSLTAHHFFNNNFRAALALCFIAAAIYFSAKWLTDYAFTEPTTDSITYLLETAIPCIFYTTPFVLPFYFLEKKLYVPRN